jgi:hypothetical protein
MDDKELEQILQGGIASYADGEPLAGLEDRILARAGMANARRSMAGWWAVVALGVAALVGIALYLRVGLAESQPVRVASEIKASLPAKPPLPDATIRVLRRRAPSHRAAALPKLRVFPTPSPLTPEERLLLAMVKQDPEGTAEAFDSFRRRGSEPLEIAPLVIPPLETSGEK